MGFFSCGCCCWWNEAQHKAECSTQLSAALPLTRMYGCMTMYACLRVCTHILFFKRVRFFVTALFSSIPVHTTFTRFSLVSHVYYMNIVFVFFFGGCYSCSSLFLKPASSCCCLYGVLVTQRRMSWGGGRRKQGQAHRLWHIVVCREGGTGSGTQALAHYVSCRCRHSQCIGLSLRLSMLFKRRF